MHFDPGHRAYSRFIASRPSSRSVLIAATAVVAAWSALQGFRLMHSRYRRIVPRELPALSDDAAATAAQDHATRRFLIVGDSTGLGVGCADPRSSIAGRLGAAFPHTEVVNLSCDGAMSADVAEQIEASEGWFDLILISVGTQDVIRLSPYANVAEAAESALAVGSGRATHVAVIPPADIGTAPVWIWPLNAVYSSRAERVRRAWQVAMRELSHVHLVDLRLPSERDPFRIKPRRYYSPDGIHPNAEGYALWFAQITRQVPVFNEVSRQPSLV